MTLSHPGDLFYLFAMASPSPDGPVLADIVTREPVSHLVLHGKMDWRTHLRGISHDTLLYQVPVKIMGWSQPLQVHCIVDG